MTPHEFNLALTGYFEEKAESNKASFQQRMEAARFNIWQWYNLQQPKHKRIDSPVKLLAFAWDEETEQGKAELTEVDRQHFESILDDL